MIDKNGLLNNNNLDNSINRFTSESRKCFQYSNQNDLVTERSNQYLDNNTFKSLNMNIQNVTINDNFNSINKNVKPGGILKKNKTPTKNKLNFNKQNYSESDLNNILNLKNMNSVDTLNLNDTNNTVEYTIENLSPIRGNSVVETNQLIKSIKEDTNGMNINKLKNQNVNRYSQQDSAKLRDSVESDINLMNGNHFNNLNVKRINQ